MVNVEIKASCKPCGTEIVIEQMPGSYYFGPELKCGKCKTIILKPVMNYRISAGDAPVDFVLKKIT